MADTKIFKNPVARSLRVSIYNAKNMPFQWIAQNYFPSYGALLSESGEPKTPSLMKRKNPERRKESCCVKGFDCGWHQYFLWEVFFLKSSHSRLKPESDSQQRTTARIQRENGSSLHFQSEWDTTILQTRWEGNRVQFKAHGPPTGDRPPLCACLSALLILITGNSIASSDGVGAHRPGDRRGKRKI